MFVLHEELNLSWIFSIAGHRTSSTLFRVDYHFDVKVINAETLLSINVQY